MQAKVQLNKPANWQDFETLCKKLWGEIWQCREIKQNGRSGQAQHGVDVYGKPNGETQYYGIQCKGKDSYTHAQLTNAEIDTEIEKAKDFKPQIKKLYFATTANKDTKIEEYIRLKDLENQQLGLFEVHLFSWEDIVDLILEHKDTYNFYVKSIGFKVNLNTELTFLGDKNTMDVLCERQKHITKYRHKPGPERTFIKNPAIQKAFKFSNLISKTLGAQMDHNLINKSYIYFGLFLKNTGNEPIHNYKVEMEIIGNTSKIELGKIYKRQPLNFDLLSFKIRKISDTHWQIVPGNTVLVPQDYAKFETFALKPIDDKGQLEIKWRLLSAEKTESGSLFINYDTTYYWQLKEIIIDPEQPEYNDPPQFTDYFEHEYEH
ncbi:restriction endonuclease [Edaphocola aurantiacus]|uniref:restriction endonuclease n=1 Tax=Edaphocola aurantiacus TaxID=2601682 RepID=UPI001C979631|nr:hypothetical protein [Edaphocola aurantiacus]